MTLILSNAEIANIVTMEECIDALEGSFIDLAKGHGAFRRRSDINTRTGYSPDGMYVLKSMDGVVPASGVAAIRINSDVITFPKVDGSLRRVRVPAAPNNRYTGLVLLFSTDTGEPLAIFPDGVIQPMRVAATSALGAKCLAREDAADVAILGSGWQARAQARAIVRVRPIKRIRCYSPNEVKRRSFAVEMSPIVGIGIEPVDAPEAAVEGAEIVLCATNSTIAVFKPPWIEKGMHLSSIQPAELGPDVVRIVDVTATLSRDCDPVYITTHGLCVPEEPGGGIQNLAHEVEWSSLVTLPELLVEQRCGRGASRGRTTRDQVTCFLNPMGLGYQFAAVGAVVYRRAKERCCGRELPTDWFTETEMP